MADIVATIPIGGEWHQATFAASSTATAAAGVVGVAIPSGATTEQVIWAAANIAGRAGVDRNVFTVTADTRMEAPLDSVEGQQVETVAASSAEASAGLLRVVMPANTTSDMLRTGLRILLQCAAVNPHTVRG
jgi:uncharacterized membrane protein